MCCLHDGTIRRFNSNAVMACSFVCAWRVDTRKSTRGGLIRIGQHDIDSWSYTQAVIAQSPGEAEHYGAVRGTSIGI